MIENIEIGRILKEIRLYRGFKKHQIGNLIDKTSDSIKKYENGYTTIPLGVLQDFCKATDCELKIIIKCDDKEYVLAHKKEG